MQGLPGLQGERRAVAQPELIPARLVAGEHLRAVGSGERGAVGAGQAERVGERGVRRGALVAGDLLGNRQLAGLLVGHPHGDRPREQVGDVAPAQPPPGGRRGAAALGRLLDHELGPPRVGGERRRAARPQRDVVEGAAAGQAVARVVVLQVHGARVGGGRGTPVGFGPGGARPLVRVARHQSRPYVVERRVDAVVGGELPHAAHHAPDAARDRHAVVGGARVGVDARVVHGHRDERGVDRVALGGRRLDEVVASRVEGRAQAPRKGGGAGQARRPARLARQGEVAGRHAGDGLRALGDRRGPVLTHRRRRGCEQAERRPRDRLAQLVDLLHDQAVLDVRDIEDCRELPAEVGGVEPRGVVGRRLGEAIGRRVEVVHPIAGRRRVAQRGVLGHDAAVGPDVARHVLDRRLVQAVRVEPEQVGVAAGRLDGRLLAGPVEHGPSAQGVAVGGMPHARRVPLHHDAEHEAAGEQAVVRVHQGAVLRADVAAGGHREARLGVRTRPPRVGREQHGVRGDVGVEVQRYVGRDAVARRDRLLAQDPVGALVAQLRQGDGEPVGAQDAHHTRIVRHTGEGGLRAGRHLVRPVGRVEGEAGPRDGVAVLVDLDGARHGDRHEVVAQLHVRGPAPALEVVEVERVVGVVGEGEAVPPLPVGRPGEPKALADSGHLVDLVDRLVERAVAVGVAVHHHRAGLEVDEDVGLDVDAAEVAHQHAVDEDPHVVVARELVGHRLAVVRAAVLLHEARRQRHAEPVVHAGRIGIHVELVERPVLLLEDLRRIVEGEELTVVVRRVGGRAAHAPRVVDVEGVAGRVQGGEVAGGVEVVVPVVVDLQQAVDVEVGGFALLAAVCLGAAVEQVGKRLAARQGEVGVAVRAERRGDDALARHALEEVERYWVGVGARCAEAQVVIGVDADVEAIVRVCEVARVPVDQPVVEQADGRPVGGDRLHEMVGEGRGRRRDARLLGKRDAHRARAGDRADSGRLTSSGGLASKGDLASSGGLARGGAAADCE